MRDSLTVGAVARLAGVTPKTVRFYESIGLLPPATRSGNGYRLYDQKTISRLDFIRRAKVLGLSLREIRDLVEASDEGLCTAIGPELRNLVRQKLVDCDQRLDELVAFRAMLLTASEQLEDLASTSENVIPECTAFMPGCTCIPSMDLDIAPHGKP